MADREPFSGPPSFATRHGLHHADTCEALRAAAGAGEVRLWALARGQYPGERLPAGAAPGLCTVGFWDAPGPQGWGLDWHRNEGIEVTCLLRGSVDFAVDEGRWTLRPGQVTVTRPWQRHRVGRPHVEGSRLAWLVLDVGVRRPGQSWQWPPWVALDPADRRRLTVLLRHNEQPVWPGGRALRAAFEDLCSVAEAPRAPTLGSRLTIGLNRALLALLEALEEQDAPLDGGLASPRRDVEMFLGELDERLDHPWTLAEMAEACGLRRSRFAAYVRELTNMAPIQHLNARRLARRPRCSSTSREPR